MRLEAGKAFVMFNADLQSACLDLRGNIFERFRSELAGIGEIMAQAEDKTRTDAAGLIGARAFRQYEGDLSPADRTRLLSQIKAVTGDLLKRRLLQAGAQSLKDKLQAGLDDLQAAVYNTETEKIAEVMASLMPEGVKIGVAITKKELDDLRRMPLAGLSVGDYIQKVLVELYFGIIQSLSLAFTDAKTFEGGIKFGLADISRKFDTAGNRIRRLAQELTVQASNKALMDISAAFKMKVV